MPAIDTWWNCYADQWGDELVPEAFGHPAKGAPGLSKRIYDHALECGWLQSGTILTVSRSVLEYVVCQDNCIHVLTAENQPAIHVASNALARKEESGKEQIDQLQLAQPAAMNSITFLQNHKHTVVPNVGLQETEKFNQENAQPVERHSTSKIAGENIAQPSVIEKLSLGISTRKAKSKLTELTNQETQEYQGRHTGNGVEELTSNITELNGKRQAENLEKKSENAKRADQQITYKSTTKSPTDIATTTAEITSLCYVLPVTEKLISLLTTQYPYFSQPGNLAWLKNQNEIRLLAQKPLEIGDTVVIEPDRIIDPFGGVAGFGLQAMAHGLTWIGVELEPKFVTLGNQNIELWNHRYSRFSRWGSGVLLQGDSRNLLQVIEAGRASGCISSPPFADGGMGDDRKFGGIHDPSQSGLHRRNHSAVGGLTAYGSTPGQLGSMREGDFRGVVSSPPFESSLNSVDDDFIKNRLTTGPSGSKKLRGKIGAASDCQIYGNSDGQLGASSNGDFWSAARVIVAQTFAALRPGAHAIWIVKSFVRNKAIVDFPGQWRQLCESCGFVTLHEHHAMLVAQEQQLAFDGNHKRKERKSFFRRLAESKGSPRIDFETVLLHGACITGVIWAVRQKQGQGVTGGGALPTMESEGRMSVDEIKSDWRETNIICKCGCMMYSDGKHRPQCDVCLKLATDEQCWTRLTMARPDEVAANDQRPTLRELDPQEALRLAFHPESVPTPEMTREGYALDE